MPSGAKVAYTDYHPLKGQGRHLRDNRIRISRVHFGPNLELEGPFWLVKDRSVQCFAGGYYFFMSVAVFTLVVFAFGFPLGVLILLKHVHDQKAIVLKHSVEAKLVLYRIHNRWCPRADFDR
eukprot:9456136-Pyramimonas_sp.AAC.2